MKNRNHRQFIGALLALLTILGMHPAHADDASKNADLRTFTVQAGAAPWYDEVGTWSLVKVPSSLNGVGPVPQQSCTSRALDLPGKPKSIVLGVFVGDTVKFEQAFPDAKATGDSISVKNAAGTELAYTVLTLTNPPARIVGAGIASKGLLLLKTDASSYKPSPGAAIAATGPASPSAVALPAKPKFQIYLLMGQSNMVGEDPSRNGDQVDNPQILALNDAGQWVIAREPMSTGGKGIGPGIPFAAAMLKAHPGITIGLVPCAVGGTPLSRWVQGGDLYQRAVARARAASGSGEIKGMLWHQGESDTVHQETAATYGARLTQMFTDLRQDLGLPNLPIVVGQLGPFLSPQKYPYVDTVRGAIAAMPGALPNVGFADSEGLTDLGDRLHFTAASQEQFGGRYASAMLALQKGGGAGR